MEVQSVELRPAQAADLGRINGLIERALDTWDLPARVKRLALPTYRYTGDDLQAMDMVCAWLDDRLLGVVAWETDRAEAALAVHGLYVEPDCRRQGVGSVLLKYAEQRARAQGLQRVRVKAQPDARRYFEARGFAPDSGHPAGIMHTP